MHIEFCTKLNFLEGEYAITQNIGFLLSSVGTPCRYLVLWPCKIRADFIIRGGLRLRPGAARRRRSRPAAIAAMVAEVGGVQLYLVL
jgi:hypothetical protein